MAAQTTRERVQKINQAKEIIAELESKTDIRLSGPRGALHNAGCYVDNDSLYFGRIEDAMGQTAGLAIEGGYDEVASDASQLVTDIQENVLDDE